MASLADVLAYQQKQKEMLNQMSAKPTFGERLENLSYAAGEGFVDQLRGLEQLVTHPVQSAKDIYQGVKTAVQNPRQALQAATEGIKEAVSSPESATRFLAQNFSPVDLANALNKVGTMRELTVYHGTPHRFEPTEANPLGEFRASQIGTGEGAAAYGHGIYLAESPKVASGYAIPRGIPDLEEMANKRGLQLSRDARIEMARQAKTDKDSLSAAKMLQYANSEARAMPVEKLAETIDIYRNALKPSFYHADLPDEMIDKMLDWDKPLSEQPAAVKSHVMRYMNVQEGGLPADMRVMQAGSGKYVVVQEKPPLPGAVFGYGRSIVKGPKAASEKDAINAYWNSLTGADFYKTLASDVGESASASNYLRDLGIPGIKYLDAGSRGQSGSGTRNFVVFPGEESKVKILKRE